MATLEKKSPSTFNKLQHQQSLPTQTSQPTSTTVNHHHSQLQQQMSQPMIHHNGKSSSSSVAVVNGGGCSESMQVSNEQQSDNSSLYSVELEPLNIDSDPGFGSMSSSEQAQTNNRQQQQHEQQESHQREVEELSKEVTKLKNDKLDLLRQNVVSVVCTPHCINCSTNSPSFLPIHSTFRHVSEISNDFVNASYHFRATFPQQVRKLCDYAKCYTTSPVYHRWLRVRQLSSTAAPQPCCERTKREGRHMMKKCTKLS